MQFLLDVLGDLIKFAVKVVLAVIGIGAAQYDPVFFI
jgi:hypothetical protein